MNDSYNESNFFDRLVIKHYKLKAKKHLSGDKHYSDYDVLVGMQIVLVIGVWLFTSFAVASLFLAPLIFCWLLNNIDFTKKEPTEDE